MNDIKDFNYIILGTYCQYVVQNIFSLVQIICNILQTRQKVKTTQHKCGRGTGQTSDGIQPSSDKTEGVHYKMFLFHMLQF